MGSAAALLTLLSAASALLGFGRDVVIAAVFGAGAVLDAYLVSQGLMNLILGLVAGAMAKALVPVVARATATEEAAQRANHSATVVLSVTVLVLGVASVMLWLLTRPVVRVLAPGFDAAQSELAVTSTRIILVAVVFVAGTNLLAAVAQARRRFFWAGVQGVPFNLVMIGTVAAFGPRYGVAALAAGFVLGSAARLVCQLVPLRAIGLRLRISFDLRDPGFRSVARLAPPLLVGSAIVNVNTLVDRAVGSFLGEGVISALSYGWRLVTLPEMLVVVSLVTVLYPAFGAAADDRGELRRLVGQGLSTVMVVIAPMSAALLVCAPFVVQLVYQRGSFDAEAGEATSTAVMWYAPALLALAWREVVTRASYAVGDTVTPVLVALVAMAVNVVGDVTLGPVFGVPGLAGTTVLSVGCAALLNTWLLRRRHGAVRLRHVAGLLARTGCAAVLSVPAGLLCVHLVADRIGDGAVGAAVTAALSSMSIAAVFLAVLAAIRAPELSVLNEAVRIVLRRG
ncbi:murein biosynthesis integral membrane protein MurJ [Actinopolymorpha sp. B11F2]|uniref:murein biosynthesis integral membrane protein MurJ n=1 Tax=Actinopolymorpha sp. B11F2 TaxID=3160862 RepID=UPI0032E4634B